MATEVTRREAEELKKSLTSAYRNLSNIKNEMKESLAYARQTMEVGLTSFAVSWALAKWGGPACEVTLIGVPVELGGALVLKAVAFSGLLDGYAGDAHNIGDGMLGVYLVKKGFQMGARGDKNANPARTGTINVAGALPAAPTHYAGLSDADLARAMAA